MRQTLTATFTALALAGAAHAQDAATGSAKFVDAEGKSNGTAQIMAMPSGGVLIKLDVSGLPESQWVAFHVHETGSCDPATKHESAGGHFNPGSKEHGYQSANGPHAGDMPNQYVGADGSLKAEVFNSMVTLGEGENGIKGRALMVHAKGDDYKSQPSGNAGNRLACAVIE
ncbi:superoxide dismutase family protein [Rhizobium sp. SSA_523]|uniref:superoxide dismutase family protein n=1 Tax=Rhizobium sp. SSA_523 TaxID=2952477 RepID=UPI00209190D4|nr:superoxide dismutase family protein [Rhizobium sp. SSA_523]MCO5732132.1 superoxide dismutase family protein [Rhizobium sp. SSA_523]WKC25688.1 superoxide dismutase family protein [Rhizobium sp. SSA_523]